MGAISKICTVALVAGSMGVSAKPMEHEARDVDFDSLFPEIAKNINGADLMNKISNEYVHKLATQAAEALPDLVDLGKEKAKWEAKANGQHVKQSAPLSTGTPAKLPKFPTTTGTSGRFPPKPVTTGTSGPYPWPGTISKMPMSLPAEAIESMLESDQCVQLLSGSMVNKEERNLAGWETKCVPKIFSNYTGDEKAELEKKFIEAARNVPNKVGEPGYFDHLYRTEEQFQAVVEMAKMAQKAPKGIVLYQIEIIGSQEDAASPPWKWDSSQHPPSTKEFPYSILDNTEVCIYQVSPNIGQGDKNKLEEYGNICFNAIFSFGYDTKTVAELTKKTLDVVSSLPDVPNSPEAFNLSTKFEEMLQSIRAMAYSRLPKEQLMMKIEEFRPMIIKPLITRRTDRPELTDEVILNISGMYRVAEAIVKGDKKLVLAAMEPQNLFFYTTHSGADIAEMEKKIEELVLSIPSTTPLKAVQDRLATLTRTVLANSSPKAEIMKKLNDLAPLLSAGSAARYAPRSPSRVVRREEKEGDKITVSSSAPQAPAVNASQNATKSSDGAAAPSSRLMQSAGALVLGSLAVAFLL